MYILSFDRYRNSPLQISCYRSGQQTSLQPSINKFSIVVDNRIRRPSTSLPRALDPFFSPSLDLIQLQVHMGRFSGGDNVVLVREAAGIDKLDSIQSAAAPIALISTGVFVTAMRTNSFHKTVCKKSGNDQNAKGARGWGHGTLNRQCSRSAPFPASRSSHSWQDLGKSPGRSWRIVGKMRVDK